MLLLVSFLDILIQEVRPSLSSATDATPETEMAFYLQILHLGLAALKLKQTFQLLHLEEVLVSESRLK